MAIFTITIRRNQQRKDGRYPISIRVAHNGKSVYIPTGHYAGKAMINRKFELKDRTLVDAFNERIEKFEKILLDIGDRAEVMTAAELVDMLVDRTSAPDKIEDDFFSFAEKSIERMKADGRINSAMNYRSAINCLKKFRPEKLPFETITGLFLRDFEQFIINNSKTATKTVRAQSLYMSEIRAIFNRAREQYNDYERNIVLIPNNPFATTYRVPKSNVPAKRGLNSQKIKQIIDYKPVKKRDELAQDVFLLSFLLVGMNMIDLYNVSEPTDGNIIYERSKTKDRRADRAEICVKIEPEAQFYLDKYKGSDGRAFCFDKMYVDVSNLTKAVNKGLKIIGKETGVDNLQFYAARHSWATIALNECGIPKSDVHEFLNHSDPSLKITDYYIQKDWSRLASANRKVIDLVFVNFSSI